LIPNPFDELSRELKEIKELILNSSTKELQIPSRSPEIIDTNTLCTRLGITEPTVIRHRKRGLIPFLTIGSSVRYEWHTVIKALENKKKVK
jgi:hypothetical protein